MSDQKYQFFNSCTPLIDSDQPPQEIKLEQTLSGKIPFLGQELAQDRLLSLGGPTSIRIQVNGPQVALNESDIGGVYPAPGSTESPEDFLPHIALTRRTLPWERSGPDGTKPWLALLLVKNSELNSSGSSPFAPIVVDLPIGEVIRPPTVTEERIRTRFTAETKITLVEPKESRVSVEAQNTASYLTAQIPALRQSRPALVTAKISSVQSRDLLGFGRLKAKISGDPTVNLLYLRNSILAKIRPAQEDLKFLCNVKRSDDGRGHIVDHAIVIGNRLPSAGKVGEQAEVHTAFLVSLDGRDDFYAASRDKKPSGEIALVVLHSWSFTPSQGGDFEQVVRAIHIRPNGGVLRFGNLPAEPAAGGTAPLSGGFDALLDEHGLFLSGVPHTQSGNATYRGPLRPFPPAPRSLSFAVRSAPEEFAGAPPGAPLDFSHAAAFEAGRLLALANQDVLENLRQIHGILKPIDPAVIKGMPVVLQKPAWLPDPSWVMEDPWAVVVDDASRVERITKSPVELIGENPGDVSGVSQHFQQDGESVLSGLKEMAATPAEQLPTSFDISSVTEAELERQFAQVRAKGMQ